MFFNLETCSGHRRMILKTIIFSQMDIPPSLSIVFNTCEIQIVILLEKISVFLKDVFHAMSFYINKQPLFNFVLFSLLRTVKYRFLFH